MVTRPPRALPRTRPRSIPKSRATLRIAGDAATAAFDCSRDSEDWEEADSSSAGSSGSGAVTLAFGLGVSATGFAATAAAPSPDSVRILWPTLILSPFLTNTLETVPAAVDGI